VVSFEELTGLRAEGFAEFEADLRVEEFGEGKMYGKEGGEVAEVGEEFEVVGDDFPLSLLANNLSPLLRQLLRT